MKASFVIILAFLKSSLVYSDGYTVISFYLVNGTSPNEGRVEVEAMKDNGRIRGVISDDSEEGWSIDEANRICSGLNYKGAAIIFPGSKFGSGQPADVFGFTDEEGKVDLECAIDGSNDCSEEGAAGVVCHKPGYLGCFRIGRMERERAIQQMNVNTNDDCLALCRGDDVQAIYAAQREDMCLCSNDSSILRNAENNCNMRCDGNDKQLCGGGRESFSVFNVSVGFCPEISGDNLNVYGRYRFGDIVKANCSGGLRLMGDAELQCLGGPDVFDWTGKVPSCVGGTTVRSRSTNLPNTGTAGRTMAPGQRTDITGVERMTDATPTISVTMGVGMGARTASKSLAVPIAVSVVGALIVAVLAILLFFYITRTRKTQSEMKEDIKPTSPKSKFNNLSYSMQNIPNKDGPSYYETEPNATTRDTEGTDNLIDNVLYKPADNVRKDPNQCEPNQQSSQIPAQYGLIDNVLYKPADDIRRDPNRSELDQSSPTNTPHYGLVDNVLYKPADGASDNFGQIPNGHGLPSDDAEYAYADERGSRGVGTEGGLIDNILYKPADNPVTHGASSRKYYDIKPETDSGDYAEADRPIPDNTVPNGPRYYEIEPQPSHSPPPSNIGNYRRDTGYDPVHETGDDTTEPVNAGRNGPRFVVCTDDTTASHGYTKVDDGLASGVTTADTKKQGAFPRYAKVQKSRKT